MKRFLYYLAYFFLIYIAFSKVSYATDKNIVAKNNTISAYALSESFSNILPIKQLIEDDWLEAPASDSSIGFTQNEVGIKSYWNNFSITFAHRIDYFVYTNSDTANAFYLERTEQPLTNQDSYQLALTLHHQRSKGFRLGYLWHLNNFSFEFNLGYWDVLATRESQINGEIFGDEHNNITGTAQLSEFYSDKNFLKRDNFNRWDVNGYGVTLDFAANWQINNKLYADITIKDLYSTFKMQNLGYSKGKVDTEGTFINSLGGKSYLPLYQGIETSKNYQFTLPEHINITTQYQGKTYDSISVTTSYLASYKRQGDVNFYYAGLGLAFDKSSLKLLIDLEHLSPEIHYDNQWLNFVLAMDDIHLDKVMQFSLGFNIFFAF